MKKCPQCEFIYEDDQSRCDMDDAKLVFDPRALSGLTSLATSPSVVPVKAHWRGRALHATAAVILATVLFLVYYVSTQRHAVRNANYAPATVSGAATSASNGPAPNEPDKTTRDTAASPASSGEMKDQPSAVGEANTSSKIPVASEKETQSAEPEKPATSKPASVTPTAPGKKSKAKPKAAGTPKSQSSVQTTPTANARQESTISSLLKKTGRFLKKPFKQ